jgi:hypothetical protein
MRLPGGLIIALCLFATRAINGQGGPPMITDDPGTPGNGHWENNFAITFEHRPNEWLIEAPTMDLNYGVGEQVQLNLQTAVAILKRADHGAVAGMSSTEVAVKWRFLDQDGNGVDMSTYPRIIFNVAQSSVRRGLADEGTRAQFPVQMARKFGPVDFDLEVGPLVSTVGHSEWLYGIVGGVDVSKRTSLMAELHGSARSNFTHDVLTLNVGLHQKLSENCNLITSVGHDVRSPNDTALALVGYFGLQLLY